MEHICIIKFLINPVLNEGYEIKYFSAPSKKMIIRFISKSSESLLQTVETFRQNISINCKYKVQFDFLSTPKSIKNNSHLLNKIRKMFWNGAAELDVENFCEKIYNHAKKYGNSPNFADDSDIGFQKNSNYIKSVCGYPNLPETIIEDILSKINEIGFKSAEIGGIIQ